MSTKKGECLRSGGGLSYTRMTESCCWLKLSSWVWTLSSLACIVESQPQLMQGCQIDCLKRHGHWRSKTAKDGYIKDSVGRRLTVYKGLVVQLGVL